MRYLYGSRSLLISSHPQYLRFFGGFKVVVGRAWFKVERLAKQRSTAKAEDFGSFWEEYI